MASSYGGESFGQETPPLYEMIKNILVDYPSGQIFKEIIQNADDARATEVKFYLDYRSLQTLPPNLVTVDNEELYNGPALLSYNNAPFKGEDWEGITKICRSGKAKNPYKVGKFGIGFNSVYHITDLPVILSEDYCGFLEPQGKVWEGKTGRRYKLNELAEMHPSTLYQFENIGGYSQNEINFKGKTLLRFPLRKTESSLISNEVYSLDKLKKLLDNFKKETEFLLVFLRSVLSVEVYVINNNKGKYEMFCSVSIDQNNEKIKFKRLQFCSDIETVLPNDNILNCSRFSITVHEQGNRINSREWIVVNQVGSKDSEVLKLAEKQSVLPWVGTAVEISSLVQNEGRIFCVLPLPVEDRVPFRVHVNGTFAVSSNRRSLKWEVQERIGEIEGKWNNLLVSRCLPSCYVKLIEELIRYGIKADIVYKYWPNVNNVLNTPWSSLLEPFYKLLLCSNKVIYTTNKGGEWISINEGTFIDPNGEDVPLAVKNSAINCDINIVELNDVQWSAIDQYYKQDYSKLTPSKVRHFLKKNLEAYNSMSRKDKLDILDFCLKEECVYGNLIGLQLLPLVNGNFIKFVNIDRSPSNEIDYTFICTKKVSNTLLPGLEHQLVNLYIEKPEIHERLCEICCEPHSMIKELDSPNVAKLLSKCNTATWSSDQLTKFWNWLNKEKVNLVYFNDKFIVPVKDSSNGINIVPLAKKDGLIYISTNSSYSLELLTGLEKLGITFVNANEFPYLSHPQLHECLYQFKPNDVLESMSPLDITRSYLLTKKEAIDIQNFLSQTMLEEHFATFCTLPLFKTLQDTTLYSINYMKTNYCDNKAIIMCENYYLRKHLLPIVPLIIDKEENDTNLISKLVSFNNAIKIMSLADYILKVAFPMIKNGIFDNKCNIIPFMQDVLDHFDILRHSNGQLPDAISSLPFISVESSETLQSPCNLFDPEIEILKELFLGTNNKFPGAQFEHHLPVLRQCGLRATVTPLELFDIVTSLAQNEHDIVRVSEESHYIRIKAVLKYLCTYSAVIDHFKQALLNHGKQYVWLPVSDISPCNYPSCLTWKGSKHTLSLASTKYTPMIALTGDINSSDLPMIAGSQAVFIENVPNELTSHINSLPNDIVKAVVAHFHLVIEKTSEIPNHILKQISVQTYKYLFNNLSLCDQSIFKGRWIWIEGASKFINSKDAAIEMNPSFRTSLEPYIFTNLSQFIDLFTKCGVSEQVTVAQIVSVLQSIKNSSNEEITHEGAWSIVEAIIDWLVKDTETRLIEGVLVPIESDNEWPQLLPLSEICYTDNEMLREVALIDKEKEYHLIHPKVSHLSSQLGLTPLSDYLDITEDVFEDAGQHEPLVTRLSNILKDYKDGLTIIKEMIQNADDAGATEVNILYDNRTHSTENLLFKGMGQCHGPALIVHNNSTFTKEDFENITKLAGATKANQPLKIGKFGVGFCSVYHITDVPSFVSEEWLYIFDPTLKYLKGVVHNETRPGKKIKYQSKFFANSKQLVPYEGLFNFSPTSTYNGTMFRLPFRTSSSQISSTIYDDHMIAEMKKALKSNGSQLLLFLQNVKKITFDSLNNSSDKVTIELTHNDDSIKSCITNITHEEYWLMSTSEEALKLEHTDKLAVASVACKLIKKDDNTFQCQTIDGAVFCFLPLGVPSTGLPVHISANFAVMSNRSGIWTSTTGIASDSREVWNQQLMETVIPKAYCNLLIKLRDMTSSGKLSSYDFHFLWPLEVNLAIKHPWDKVVVSLYKLISQECLIHSVSIDKWLTFDQSHFLLSSLFGEFISSETLNDVVNKLKLPIVSLSSQLYEQIKKIDIPISAITEWEFTEKFLANITIFSDSIETRNIVLSGILLTTSFLITEPITTHDTLFNLLNQHECIPCSPDGINLKLANSLVDPVVFQDIFDPEDGKFPLESLYKNRHIHTVLVELGLLSSNLSWEMIIDSTNTVQALYSINKEKALKRMTGIIKCIDSKTKALSPLVGELINIPFLPVLDKPDGYVLPWKSEGTSLLPPSQVVAVDVKKFSVIVGSQQAIIDTTSKGCGKISDKVLKVLNISNKPGLDDVLSHFVCVIQNYKLQLETNLKLLETMCSSSYKYFEKELGDVKTQPLANQKLSVFGDKPFIWTKESFVSPCDVAVNWKSAKGPYLYKVPAMISEYSHLIKCLHINESFDLKKLLDTFQKMYNDLSKQTQIPSNYKEIIDEVISVLNSVDIPDKLPDKIYLPSEDYVMHDVNQLTYNDAPWLQKMNDNTFVHANMSKKMALFLGVKCTRDRYLQKFTLVSGFQGLPFGQREELTQRIKNILRDYPLDVTFLKELLQNADDAKATKMCVILDKRQHGTEKLLSKEWEELQGPAVLVWNDRDFSEKDLEGIQRLGLGSKRDDDESIGQFGIGFNVVYHLTDCPSFITREGSTLCVFDPHCKYVPGACSECPGSRYDIKNEFWENFSDLCSPYLHNTSHSELTELSKKGVLFRFPLRTTERQLKSSKLIDEPSLLTTHKMEECLKEWVSLMEDSLLFLNHILEFKFYVINESSVMTCKRSYNVLLSDENYQKRVNFKKILSEFRTNTKAMLVNYPLTITTNSSDLKRPVSSKWIIQQGVGNITKESHEWNLLKESLPKHGIAAPFSGFQNFIGKVFCFLPLPVSTNLPVHINGQFVLNSNRRSLWSGNNEDRRTKWNDDIIDAISSSYAYLLHDAIEHFMTEEAYPKGHFYSTINRYYGIFPSLKIKDATVDDSKPISLQEPWLHLARGVYEIIKNYKLPVIATEVEKEGGLLSVKWHTLHSDDPSQQIYFLKPKMSHKLDIIPILKRIKMLITCAPRHIYHGFKSFKLELISRSSVFKFYTVCQQEILTNELPCLISETPFLTVKDFKIFLSYCLDDIEGKFPSSPNGKALLLTADEQLRVFDDLNQVLLSRWSSLFTNSLDKFIYSGLIDLSMSSSYFLSKVLIRFDFIKKLFDENFPSDLKEDIVSRNVIRSETLKEIWNCISEPSSYFICHQKDIVKTYALLPSLDPPMLYSSSSIILPVIESDTYDCITEVNVIKKVVPVLKKLYVPFIDLSLYIDAMSKYCPALDKHSKILDILYEIFKIDKESFTSLLEEFTEEQLRHLIEYLGQTIYSTLPDKIKCLPLYRTKNGKLSSIESKKVYLWPSDNFCSYGYEKWAPFESIIFLERTGAWKALDRRFESFSFCKKLAPSEVYCEIIFKVFPDLTYEERKHHLIYIRDKLFPDIKVDWNSFRKYKVESFCSEMKHLKFLTCSSDTTTDNSTHLLPVSSFVDHTVSIFHLYPEKFNFLDEEYKKEEWQEFLQFFGLRIKLWPQEFFDFCTLISQSKSEDTLSASNQLVEYLFSTNGSEIRKDKNIIQGIRDINFIHVATDINSFSWIAQPKIQGLTKFSESIINDHAQLVWTVKPVLPLSLSTCDKHKELIKLLNVFTDPVVDDVFENILNISKSKWSNFSLFDKYPSEELITLAQQQTIIDVICNNLKFIHEQSPDKIKDLVEVPCIPVNAEDDGNIQKLVLVNSLQVIMNKKSPLFPYVCQLPDSLNPISNELTSIGVSHRIEVKHIQYILKTLFERNSRIHSPNDKTLVVKLLHMLHELGGSDSEEFSSPLYLPSVNDTLILSTELLYLDMKRYKKGIVSTLDFSKSKYSQFYIPKIPQLSSFGTTKKLTEKEICRSLPLPVRPFQLSHVCHEEILQPISYVMLAPSKLEEHFRNLKMVTQQEFCKEGLSRIITSPTFCSTLIELIQNLELKTVSDLTSQIKIDTQLVGEIIVDYLLQKKDTYVLYTNISITKIETTLLQELATSLCIEVGSNLNENHIKFSDNIIIIAEFLKVQSSQDFQALLEKYEVNDIEIEEILIQDNNLPVMGEPLSDYWVSCIESDANYLYRPQEWVGYENSEDHFIWAVVLHPVVQDNVNDNPLLRKYVIQIKEDNNGEEEEGEIGIEVSILSLYKLVNKEVDNEEVVTVSQEQEACEINTETLKQLKIKINEQLKLIWELPEDEKKKGLRRLYLQYHPDKVGPVNVLLYEELFKYLMQQIDRLQNGLPLSDPNSEEDTSFTVADDLSTESSSYWSGFYNQWNESAGKRKPKRNRGKSNRTKKSRWDNEERESKESVTTSVSIIATSSSSTASGTSSARPSNSTTHKPDTHFIFQPRTNMEEAKRWMRQATSDLQAMNTLCTHISGIAPQVIFMAHQVMEKSLKAGMYAKLGLNDIYLVKHYLTSHAIALSSVDLSLSSLRELVSGMESCYLNTRYPNKHVLPKAPVDHYTTNDAIKFSEHAQKVYDLISALI